MGHRRGWARVVEVAQTQRHPIDVGGLDTKRGTPAEEDAWGVNAASDMQP